MTFEDNIARVRELLIQRDEIDSELEGLIGGGAGPATAAARPTKEKPETGKKAGKKGARHCSKCGGVGHIARHCTGVGSRDANAATTRMTEDQFDELKHLQGIGDLVSKDFAHDNDIALSEVNRAIASRNFDEYSNF